MPLGKALLIFHQRNIDQRLVQDIPKLALTTNNNGNDASNSQTCLPPINAAAQFYSSYDMIPSDHKLDTNDRLQTAMAERKEKCVRARCRAAGRKEPERKGLPSRELFHNQLKFRHILREIKRDSYLQWLKEHSQG